MRKRGEYLMEKGLLPMLDECEKAQLLFFNLADYMNRYL